mmetsp:Transcript_36503/g.37171  ORF Transcript_36503/g.37171 Transcript_36503/m.37171 type:complete len:146 (-) Transcript_36503:74-511(-)
MCRHLANTPHSSLRALFIITYSATAHAWCLAALSAAGLTVLEESLPLNPRIVRLRGRFISIYHGILSAFPPSPEPVSADLFQGPTSSRIRLLLKNIHTAGMAVSSHLGEHLALHQSPYSFRLSVNNSDHVLTAQIREQLQKKKTT